MTAADPFAPDEIVGTLNATSPTSIDDDVAAAFNLVLIERSVLELTGDRLVRYRIPDGRDMLWGMGTGGLLGLLVCALIIAALAKYLFFDNRT